MKKKMMVLMLLIVLILTAACATNTQAGKEKSKPSYYPIINMGVGQYQNQPDVYIMVNKHGSLWTLDASGVTLDADLTTLEGACVYGVLELNEGYGGNTKEIEKIVKCPE